MPTEISFRCGSCGDEHFGMPTFGFSFPIQYMDVPEAEREERVFLTADLCVIDDEQFFVRGCLEIPVHGAPEPFIWGVWVSLSEKNFMHFQDLLGVEVRSEHGPFAGRLCSPPRPYPDSCDLKARVHLRDHGTRPRVELQPSSHPLAVEQREGMTMERLAEIYAQMVHGARRAG